MTQTNSSVVGGRPWVAAVAISLVLTACGGAGSVSTESTPQPAASGPATITIIQEGGCQMMGPNCPTYELDRDGTFRLFRTGDPAVVTESQIDAATTAEVWDQLAEVDIAALIERAGPGSCQACVDGIDTVISYTVGTEEVSLASTAIAFDTGEPFFAVINEAIEAMGATAPMPIEQR
ncbi:MAG: hypothetical protein ACRDVD_03550 [Acidimicrobiia bacterium]